VQVYVDNVKVGEAVASKETPHHIVHRLCELDMHIAGDMEQPALQEGVGFELRLPELTQGKHEVIHTPPPLAFHPPLPHPHPEIPKDVASTDLINGSLSACSSQYQ